MGSDRPLQLAELNEKEDGEADVVNETKESGFLTCNDSWAFEL